MSEHVGHRARWARVGLSCAAGLLALATTPRPAYAWILHEHVRLGVAGVEALDATDRATLELAWSVAAGDPSLATRLCTNGFTRNASGIDRASACVRFGALPALAGDHSCSAPDLSRALASGWLPEVLGTSLADAERFAAARDVGDRLDAWRDSQLDLQQEDERFLSRAGANDAHFQLPRDDGSLSRYLERSLATAEHLNATALYAVYHAAALDLAIEVGGTCHGRPCFDPSLSPTPATPALRAHVRDLLLLEAMALHFLQDAFSSGHIVGTWGTAGQRKGTHDYYCRHGVDARTWDDQTYFAHGDAFLGAEDVRHAAPAVARSLSQLALALRVGPDALPAVERDRLRAGASHRAFDACVATEVPMASETLSGSRTIADVLALTPMPEPLFPAPPRVAGEIGLYVPLAFATSLAVGGADARAQVYAQLTTSAGLGLGVDGLSSRTMDGRLAVEAALGVDVVGEARAIGVGMRLQLPFAVVPGDLLPLALTVLPASQSTYLRIAREAAAGSVWGRFGRQHSVGESTSWQIVLGRSATLLFFGDGFELTTPVVGMTFARAFESTLAREISLEIAGRWRRRGQSDFLGVVVTLTPRTRWYVWSF